MISVAARHFKLIPAQRFHQKEFLLAFMLNVLILVATSLSSSASAETPPAMIHSKDQLCRKLSTASGRRSLISHLESYHQSTQNTEFREGLFNLGVCWWRSRMQRSALYLTYYSPTKPMPTLAEAEAIIAALVSRKEIVEIPGFSDFETFSNVYAEPLLKAENNWQLRDSPAGALKSIDPLRQTASVHNENLFRDVAKMERMISEYGVVPYVLLQVKGIYAHSWLIQTLIPQYEVTLGNRKELVAYHGVAIDPSLTGKYFFTVKPGDTQITNYHYYKGIIDLNGLDTWTGNLYQPNDVLATEARMKNILGQFAVYHDFESDLTEISETVQRSCHTGALGFQDAAY